MNIQRLLQKIISIALILGLLVGCSTPAIAPTPVPLTSTPTTVPTTEPRADGLSDEEAATLSSLKQVDDYPLYTMHYYGAYDQRLSSTETASSPAWACSLFAALGDADNAFGMLYGRNFDWEYSPAVLLFTDPPDGYASVSMVDIDYLGYGEEKAFGLTDLPLSERSGLLDAPYLPFDGMNEAGLAVGMAAVSPGGMEHDPEKETIDSLLVIREILDRAATVDEAIAILESYNIDWGSGPPLHYLIAEKSGKSALVEFSQGEMAVIPNRDPWQTATNFLVSETGASAEGSCWRYDLILEQLREGNGQLNPGQALNLLGEVAQESTQWSVVYGISAGEVRVVMDISHGK